MSLFEIQTIDRAPEGSRAPLEQLEPGLRHGPECRRNPRQFAGSGQYFRPPVRWRAWRNLHRGRDPDPASDQCGHQRFRLGGRLPQPSWAEGGPRAGRRAGDPRTAPRQRSRAARRSPLTRAPSSTTGAMLATMRSRPWSPPVSGRTRRSRRWRSAPPPRSPIMRSTLPSRRSSRCFRNTPGAGTAPTSTLLDNEADADACRNASPEDRVAAVREPRPDRPDRSVRGALAHPQRDPSPLCEIARARARRDGARTRARRDARRSAATRHPPHSRRPRPGSADGGRGGPGLAQRPGARGEESLFGLHRRASVRGGRPPPGKEGDHPLGLAPSSALVRRGSRWTSGS